MAQNGRTILLVANLMANFESETPISFLSLIVLEIFACDTQSEGREN